MEVILSMSESVENISIYSENDYNRLICFVTNIILIWGTNQERFLCKIFITIVDPEIEQGR